MLRMPLLALAATLLSTGLNAQDLKSYEAEAEQVLHRIRDNMMREMQKAMEAGPKAAISECHHLAPEIKEQIEEESGWDIRRTSLRLRNEANQPDPVERRIMLGFEARALSGQRQQLLRSLRLIERDGEKTVHFMQAVPTFEGCLVCHGKKVAPDVASEINRLYPTDEALGYDVGDIRGAFSLYKPYERDQTAAWNEWSKIATLTLPTLVMIDDQEKVGNAPAGRILFERYCKSCHSASDLMAVYFSSPDTQLERQLCAKLETHGATDAVGDRNIAAFLKALSMVDIAEPK